MVLRSARAKFIGMLGVLVLVLFSAALGQAQTASSNMYQSYYNVTADPTGTCSPKYLQLRFNRVNGKLWGCNNGTWTQISGSGGLVVTPVSYHATNMAPACAGSSADTYFTITLTGNVSSFTAPSGCTNGQLVAFEWTQDGTGGRTVSWPAAFEQFDPVDTTANKRTTQWFRYNSGTTSFVPQGKASYTAATSGILLPSGNVVLIPDANGTFATIAGVQTLTQKTVDGDDNTLQDIGTGSLKTKSGNGATVVTTTGAQTSGRCVEIDANGNHIAAAAGCGSGGTLNAHVIPLDVGGCNNSGTGPHLNWGLTSTTGVTIPCQFGGGYEVVAKFAQSASGQLQRRISIPTNWNGGTVTLVAYFYPDAGGGTNNFRFTFDTKCYANGEDQSNLTGLNSVNTADTAINGTANTIQVVSTNLTMTGCAAGEMMRLFLYRGTAASDTTTTVDLLHVELRMTLQ